MPVTDVHHPTRHVTGEPLPRRRLGTERKRFPRLVLGAGLILTSVVTGVLASTEPLPLIALFGGVAIGLVVLSRPVLGVYALLAFLPWNDVIFQYLDGNSSAQAIGALKDVLILLLVVASVRLGFERNSIPQGIRTTVIAIAAITAASGLLTPSLLQALYGWRNDVEPLLLLLCVPAVVKLHEVRNLLTFVAVYGQVVAAFALMTWQKGISWLATLHLQQADGGFPFQFFSTNNIKPRAFSPYTGPNELAMGCLLTLAAIWTRSEWSVRRRSWLSVLPLLALGASRSRSGLLGVGALVVVLLVRAAARHGATAPPLVVISAALIALIGAIVLFQPEAALSRDTSVAGHVVSLQEAIPTVLEAPFGHGVGTAGPRAVRYTDSPLYAESYLLVLALDAGLIVMALYVALLFQLGRECLRRASDALLSRLGFLGILALSGTLICQLVLPAMQNQSFSMFLWILVGLAMVRAQPAVPLRT